MTKKGRLVLRIVLWSAVAVLFTVILVCCILWGTQGFSSAFFSLKGESKVVKTYHSDAQAFDSLEIQWQAGNVTVSPTDQEQVTVTETSAYKIKPMSCDINGGRLVVTQSRSIGFFFFGFGQRVSDLEIALPRRQYKDFLLKITSGHAKIQDVSAADATLQMTSGKIEADGLEGDTITVKSTSGSMVGKRIAGGELSVESTSGNVTLDGAFTSLLGDTTSGSVKVSSSTVLQTLDVKLTSGKFQISIPDNDGFLLDCKKTSGSLKSDFELMAPINDKNGTYRYLDGGSSGRHYSVKITSGTFILSKMAGQ